MKQKGLKSTIQKTQNMWFQIYPKFCLPQEHDCEPSSRESRRKKRPQVVLSDRISSYRSYQQVRQESRTLILHLLSNGERCKRWLFPYVHCTHRCSSHGLSMPAIHFWRIGTCLLILDHKTHRFGLFLRIWGDFATSRKLKVPFRTVIEI
jgi:hypothetical protein